MLVSFVVFAVLLHFALLRDVAMCVTLPALPVCSFVFEWLLCCWTVLRRHKVKLLLLLLCSCESARLRVPTTSSLLLRSERDIDVKEYLDVSVRRPRCGPETPLFRKGFEGEGALWK